jgi:hypothetical protein
MARKRKGNLHNLAEQYASTLRSRMSTQQSENALRKQLIKSMEDNGTTTVALDSGEFIEIVTTTRLKLTV